MWLIFCVNLLEILEKNGYKDTVVWTNMLHIFKEHFLKRFYTFFRIARITAQSQNVVTKVNCRIYEFYEKSAINHLVTKLKLLKYVQKNSRGKKIHKNEFWRLKIIFFLFLNIKLSFVTVCHRKIAKLSMQFEFFFPRARFLKCIYYF